MRILKLGALVPLLFLISCTPGSTLPSITLPVVFEADLGGTIDGAAWEGIAVGSSAPTHDIKIESKTDVNVMTIQSCHRFEHFEDVIQNGWFRANRGFEYSYNESPGLEDSGYCVLRLGAFTKQVGAGEAYGLMIFHNDKFQLPGENICNGSDGGTTGVSICQSMAGLVERIKFKVQVVTAKNASGQIKNFCSGKFIDAFTFEYVMPTGECVIEFMETEKPHRKYLHVARGFNKTIYRGAQ